MYGRVCSIVAQALGGQSIDVSELRCRFQIKQHSNRAPNTATIKITNQNPAIARQFTTPNAEFTTISIYAGYKDSGAGLLFSGQIVQAFYGRDNPTDTLTTILASDGHQAHNYGTVNTTLPAGSTPMDVINAAMPGMQKYGLQLGYLAPNLKLSTPQSTRAIPLFGLSRDVLADVAKSKQAFVSYQNGQVQMLGAADSVPGGAVVLNSKTGMIGMPTQEIGGVMVRSLINTNIKVNGLIQIAQGDVQGLLQGVNPDGSSAVGVNAVQTGQIAADGMYRVFKIDVDGDTRSTPWYMDIACLAAGQYPTSASIAANLNGTGFTNPPATPTGAAQFGTTTP